VFDRYFSLIYDFVKINKPLAFGMAVLLTVSAGIGFFFNEFDGSVNLMLPDEINVKRNIDFFRDSSLSGKIVVSLGLNSNEKDKKDLFRAAEQLAASLGPPLFKEITTGISGMDIMDESFFSEYMPQIITEEELAFIDSRINPEGVSMRLRGIYRQLLKPEGIFMTSMIYSDPLGLRLLLLDKLKTLSNFMGYDVSMEDGHFISRDGRHTMVIIQTPVQTTDSSGSGELLTALREKINELPDFISADIIGAHFHTLSNEKVIKRDIRLAVAIATAGFLLLFLIVFRDLRAIYIFLVPSAAVLVSISLSSLFMGNLSLWVIGLGTVIAGIAVDYGIHIYVAVRNNGRDAQVINHIAKPVCMGALTTICIFSAFFLSRTQGYHQLAFLSILSILLSLLAALFILPHLFMTGSFSSGNRSVTEEMNEGDIRFHKLIAALWAFSVCATFFLSFKVGFDSDIKQLDGSEPFVVQAEENFSRTWGEMGSQAFFVVSANSYEDALEMNDIIYQDAVQTVGPENFSSLAIMWPSKKTRSKKAARWKEFWKEGREDKLRRLIKEQGSEYQFSESAFSPFFNNLYKDTSAYNEAGKDGPPPIFKKHFVQERKEGFRILSFFPDEDTYIDALSNLTSHYPGTFLVSRGVLSQAISVSTSSEWKYLTIIAASLIVLLAFLFLKDIRKSLMALIPVLTSVLWLMGFIYLFGMTLNIANLFAGIVVMGLCIDYGIFMTYNYQHNMRKSAIIAISISAVTTLIGAGVLLFARHPALFSSGITLFIGILAGYISAIFVIPAIEKILLSPVEKKHCS
jgi:predicted exporter